MTQLCFVLRGEMGSKAIPVDKAALHYSPDIPVSKGVITVRAGEVLLLAKGERSRLTHCIDLSEGHWDIRAARDPRTALAVLAQWLVVAKGVRQKSVDRLVGGLSVQNMDRAGHI